MNKKITQMAKYEAPKIETFYLGETLSFLAEGFSTKNEGDIDIVDIEDSGAL